MTLQNLQNLANLQNLPQVASFAAGLQGMSNELTNNQLINAPLNLTVTSPGELSNFNMSSYRSTLALFTIILIEDSCIHNYIHAIKHTLLIVEDHFIKVSQRTVISRYYTCGRPHHARVRIKFSLPADNKGIT